MDKIDSSSMKYQVQIEPMNWLSRSVGRQIYGGHEDKCISFDLFQHCAHEFDFCQEQYDQIVMGPIALPLVVSLDGLGDDVAPQMGPRCLCRST